MKKLNNSKIMFLKIVLTVIFSTLFLVTILSLIISSIILKFDINLNYCNYFAYVVISIVSLTVPYISLYTLKNNALIMGLVCSLPLNLITICITFITRSSYTELLVKLIIITLLSCVSTLLKIKKNSNIKVK